MCSLWLFVPKLHTMSVATCAYPPYPSHTTPDSPATRRRRPALAAPYPAPPAGLIIICVGFPVFLLAKLRTLRGRLETSEVSARWGFIYEGAKLPIGADVRVLRLCCLPCG